MFLSIFQLVYISASSFLRVWSNPRFNRIRKWKKVNWRRLSTNIDWQLITKSRLAADYLFIRGGKIATKCIGGSHLINSLCYIDISRFGSNFGIFSNEYQQFYLIRNIYGTKMKLWSNSDMNQIKVSHIFGYTAILNLYLKQYLTCVS